MSARWTLPAAALTLAILQSVNGRGLQQVALPSLFPGDTGDSAAAAPSPAAASPAPASPAPAPATATKAPPPIAPLAAAALTPAQAPGPAAMAPMAGAGQPAPAAAAIATGAGDRGVPAPAPGPGSNTVDLIYMQQSGNVQMTSAPGNPGAGMLFMNNALDTTLFDEQAPLRKLGKTSTNAFLNAASNGTQWFSPPPLGVMLGFNTSANIYILLALSQPSYNYTTGTVGFNYTVVNTTAAQANTATNGFLVDYYVKDQGDSAVQPFAPVGTGATLFTPTLFYTIPCAVAGPAVPNTCTLNTTGVCSGAGHGVWRNNVFCG